jgi:hypothetical protein
MQHNANALVLTRIPQNIRFIIMLKRHTDATITYLP